MSYLPAAPAAHGRSTNPRKSQHSMFGPYRLGKTVGEGEFGKVKVAYHAESKQEVAIKLFKKESIDSPVRQNKLIREIRLLKSVDHPHIIRLYEVIETEHYIGMVMDLPLLFNYLLARRCLKEKEAGLFFAQLISAVSYMHSRGIVHRDLKLENLLLDGRRNIVVSDFGFANTFSPNTTSFMQTSCGSPCYAAPELVINDGYVGESADIWSCGVILYAMVCGYLPYDDDPANPDSDNINLLYKYILETEPEFPDYISESVKDLIRIILVPDPRKRATMAQIKAHKWLRPYVHIYENADVPEPAAVVPDVASPTRSAKSPTPVPTPQPPVATSPIPMPATAPATPGRGSPMSAMSASAPTSPTAEWTEPISPSDSPVYTMRPAMYVDVPPADQPLRAPEPYGDAQVPPANGMAAGAKHQPSIHMDGPTKRQKQQSSMPAISVTPSIPFQQRAVPESDVGRIGEYPDDEPAEISDTASRISANDASMSMSIDMSGRQAPTPGARDSMDSPQVPEAALAADHAADVDAVTIAAADAAAAAAAAAAASDLSPELAAAQEPSIAPAALRAEIDLIASPSPVPPPPSDSVSPHATPASLTSPGSPQPVVSDPAAPPTSDQLPAASSDTSVQQLPTSTAAAAAAAVATTAEEAPEPVSPVVVSPALDAAEPAETPALAPLSPVSPASPMASSPAESAESTDPAEAADKLAQLRAMPNPTLQRLVDSEAGAASGKSRSLDIPRSSLPATMAPHATKPARISTATTLGDSLVSGSLSAVPPGMHSPSTTRKNVQFTVDEEAESAASTAFDPYQGRGKSFDTRHFAASKDGALSDVEGYTTNPRGKHPTNASASNVGAGASPTSTAVGAARPSSSSQRSAGAFDYGRIKVHSGPIDQRALSSKPPPELLSEISALLAKMGMEVSRVEGEDFKLRVIRPKGLAIPDTLTGQNSDDTLARTAAGIADAIQKHPQIAEVAAAASTLGRSSSQNKRPSVSGGSSGAAASPPSGGPGRIANILASFPMSLVRRFRYMAQFGPRYDKGFDGHTQPDNLPPQKPSKSKAVDATVGEVRFHVTLHRIKNLPGLIVVDFKRLRGDIWEFKRLYHDIIPRLALQEKGI
ncbi:hypothetical protein HK105_201870 [Polyrhizophydium stewartii]|uniref:Non-specific serine/threonine protein kinase n=1 Tax=Polyrhizophydium stewartii TaxID=2732419 RepID=A0ABR4NG71_9FUNG